jgi:hypothetical protein
MRPREMPLTNEMRNERETYMHFCINKKCLTETELRKLNELYDKKCSN